MSTLYSGNQVYPATITIPSDGDPPDGSSVNAALEGLADRTTHINQRHHFVLAELFVHQDGDSPDNWASFTAETYAEVAATAKVISAQAGDYLIVDAYLQGTIDFGPPAGEGDVRLVYQVDTGSGYGAKAVVPGCLAKITHDTEFQHVSFASGLVAPANTAEIRVVLEGKVVDDANHCGLYSAGSIRIVHMGREVPT